MRRLLIIGLFVLAVAGAGYYAYTAYFTPHTTPQREDTYSPPAPPLTKEYSNSHYGFAVKMPEDFAAQEVSGVVEAGDTVLLQNSKGDGIQIIVSPFDEDTSGSYTLTKERILQDIPDLQISDEQVLNVGPNYKGVAFMSDSDEFGGSSRAVWFVFKGNLYQINTFSRLDNLLKAMFGTWNFK